MYLYHIHALCLRQKQDIYFTYTAHRSCFKLQIRKTREQRANKIISITVQEFLLCLKKKEDDSRINAADVSNSPDLTKSIRQIVSCNATDQLKRNAKDN